ncbi:MAG: hypothetical protein AAGC97_13450 [Planctomycetota bacterium]
MQLDQTHVTIRVRTLSEIGDLSLRMIRRYPFAFGPIFLMGCGVWWLIDVAVLGWIPWQWSQLDEVDDEAILDLLRYVFWMGVLVWLQVPIAGAFSTYYLGQAVFERKPTISTTWRDVLSKIFPVLWTLGVRRLAIPMTLLAVARWGQPTEAFIDFVFPATVVLAVCIVRGNRPFLAEMILLERCPLKSRDESVLTLRRRSKLLHGPMSGELVSRFLAVSVIVGTMVASFYYTLIWIRGVAISEWSNNWSALVLFYPLALWLGGSLSVIIRLLGYLDTRIRLEGWEVDLAIRAEAIRQFGETAYESVESDADAQVVDPPPREPTVATS